MEAPFLENSIFIFRILIIFFNVELLILAVLGNFYMCISIIGNSKIQKSTNYYFLNISLCNIILLAFMLYPDLFSWNFTAYDNEYDAANPEYNFDYFVELLLRHHLHKIIVTAVVLTLIAISIDMYIPAFDHKLRNLETIEFKKTFITVFGIWIISTLSIVPGIYEYEMHQLIGLNGKDTDIFETVSFTSIYNMVHSAVFFFIPILAMLILFLTKIYQKYNDTNSYLILHSSQEIDAQQENINKLKILAIVVFLYFLFWLPTVISNNIYYWNMIYHSKEALLDHRIIDMKKIIILRIFLLGTVIVPFNWSKLKNINKSWTSSCYTINLKVSAEKSFRLKPSKIKNNDVYEQ